MLTQDLDYPIPDDLIATRPAEPRDSARMLVVHRSGDEIDHAQVRDLPGFLRRGDALVFNTTAVIPARLHGRRVGSGGRIEGLFVEAAGEDKWLVMLRSNGRLRPGDAVDLLDASGAATEHRLELLEPDPDGWLVRHAGPGPAAATIERVGATPLPPYIIKARDGQVVADDLDRRWYQTVYADLRPPNRHSVAAPTAGLHFTPDLLARLASTGIGRIDVTLHVGPGTFRPITADTVGEHRMHGEDYAVSSEAVGALNQLKDPESGGGRIVAVGTTSVRVLESLPVPLPDPGRPIGGSTELMIAPPYEFKYVDAMLTNFHQPRTTLLALVAAMIGLQRLKAAYAEAIERRYRFYSYGDAMLILP